ncbi:unnamed protein product [Spirodela intermedia]|uniref:Endoglucanase n=1 Tax=Spirodela intermedia TaxID=51605 RepID=A0A7I8IEI6_SPIIN|nr:unnamed protein product [Spirodela intermedia]CAA6656208.1 unnamed protein product [Spirodela intermedia]
MRRVEFCLCTAAIVAAVALQPEAVSAGGHDYADALRKSLLFFEGQRSGKLPDTQRVTWRGDSALHDGDQIGIDLVGGYYDAGDNVKYAFPMAFSTTLLAWGVVEFGGEMGRSLYRAREAVRWGSDFLLKATADPGKVHVQVGNPYADHDCWERPEDMDTDRTVYTVDSQGPGSEVSGETAAALAAGSMVFSGADPAYASQLVQRSMAVFDFADRNRGSYNDSLGRWVCPFYCDFNGYQDELLWAAAWIHRATGKVYYWDYLMETSTSSTSLSWWESSAGTASTPEIVAGGSSNGDLLGRADEFVCTTLPESPTVQVQYSAGGLLFKAGGSNMQHATSLSFLLAVHARQLMRLNRAVRCGGEAVAPSRLVELAKSQVDYILGDNPLRISYMVGYGDKYPQRIHHRGSSLPSALTHPGHIGCKEGTPYYLSASPNPNLLVGAIVGGPDMLDWYEDFRQNPAQSEPTTYINAPMVGLLAFLSVAPNR